MSFAKRLKQNISKETGDGKHIPIVRHVNDNVLKSINGDYFFTIAISGLSYETKDDSELDLESDIRNTNLISYDGKPIVFYSHTLRRKIKVTNKKNSGAGFLSVLDDAYNRKFKDGHYYINELYLTVLYRHKSPKINKSKSNLASKEKLILSEMKDWVTNITGVLRDYDVRLLGVKKENNLYYSEPMNFLSKIINLEDIKMKLPKGKLNNFISVNRKVFGWKNLDIISGTKSKFGTLISIKNYCSETHAGMLDNLSSLPCEFVLTQTFISQSRTESIESVQSKSKKMHDTDFATGLTDELDVVIDEVASNQIVLGDNHFSLFLYCDDLEQLDDAVGQAQSELIQLGIISMIDYINIELAFWAQLPSNTAYIGRQAIISSFNYSHFASFHNLPLGKESGNKWGDSIATLTTANNTPYYFNWHYNDVGLTTIVGPTGSGKTVVTLLFLAQSMKVKPNVFYFDKDEGAKIFIKACDGSYSNINLGVKTNWNPLQLDLENASNKDFLYRFIIHLLEDNDELSSKEKNTVNDLINLICNTNKKDRILRNFEDWIIGRPELSKRIYSFKRWIKGKDGMMGEYAWVFDNDEDLLDVNINSIVGFDMTQFLDVEDIRSPILMYLFKKIENSLDGSPTIIVVDECQKPLEDKYFIKEFDNYAYTIRKLNGIVVMSTQRAKVMSKMESMVELSKNQLFFSNHKATKNDYAAFGLSDRELHIIKTLPQKQGWFLLKRPDGSIVVKADLSGCDDELAVLSANKQTLNLMHELIQESSDQHNINKTNVSSKQWMPEFYEKWRKYCDG